MHVAPNLKKNATVLGAGDNWQKNVASKIQREVAVNKIITGALYLENGKYVVSKRTETQVPPDKWCRAHQLVRPIALTTISY